MGGGDFHYKVPDWKTYKVGPHTPELENVQRMLKSLGLKVLFHYSENLYSLLDIFVHSQDPWLRNEVWRFDRRTPMGWDRFVRTTGGLGGILPTCFSEDLLSEDYCLGECCQDLDLPV